MFRIDEAERARTIDFARRLRELWRPAALGLVVIGALMATSAGTTAVLPVAVLAVAVAWFERGALNDVARPELAVLAILGTGQFAVVGFIVLSHRYQLDALPMLMLPATAACLIFPRKLSSVAVLWSVVVMIAVAFAVDAARVIADPPVLILPLGVMLSAVLPAMMVRDLELASRDTASIDALTGALNRAALEATIADLDTETTSSAASRVGVIMCDLDHFKSINDELGHDVGDLVLCELVQRLRAVLGPLTPVYRVGGEEFVVVMAGVQVAEVADVAERLRRAVREVPIAGRQTTMSFGVAAGTLDREPLISILDRADQALYGAKRAGRDRVLPEAIRLIEEPQLAMAPDVGGVSANAALRTAPPREEREDRGGRQPTSVAFEHDRGNWLVRGDFERDHIREHAAALSRTHHGALGFVALALAVSIPWLGWKLLIPALVAVPLYHLAERRVHRSRRPEYLVGGAWLLVQLAIFAGALLAERPQPYMLVLFTPMMVGMTAVFPTRGLMLLSATTVGLTMLGGVAARPDLALEMPGVVGPYLLVPAWTALLSSIVGRSSIEHRVRAVVDPLTGLLTRAALQARLAEVAEESQAPGARVSVIAFDIDDFKGLNDAHGHAVGDQVLRATGTMVREQLHALEWAFRLGGDEFLVVVPGGEPEARHLAEQLRQALAALELGGLRITGSFGVAESSPGARFDFEGVSRRADAALYEAKRAGRNCVAVAPQPVIAAPAAAASAAPSPLRRLAN